MHEGWVRSVTIGASWVGYREDCWERVDAELPESKWNAEYTSQNINSKLLEHLLVDLGATQAILDTTWYSADSFTRIGGVATLAIKIAEDEEEGRVGDGDSELKI